MNPKQKDILILALLIIALLSINYPFLDNALENFVNNYESVKVERIIDGDTIQAEELNESIRLLGINAPERGEAYYEEAAEFLEDEIFNKTVNLRYGRERQDQYGRILAYIFLNNENINLKLVENGLANYYFPSGKDMYYNEFSAAWLECLEKNINLCEASINTCSQCIELKELNINEQTIVFYNNCTNICELTGWQIKDEGRKKFIFPNLSLEPEQEVIIIAEEGNNTQDKLYWQGEDYVWTETGDTLFLRDEEGKLVLWESAGY